MTVDSTAQRMIVRQEVEIYAPPQKVWDYMASPEGMKQWLGPKEYAPQVGARVFFDVRHGDGHWHMTGQVVTVDPPRTLAFTWLETPVGGQGWSQHTLVTLTLTPTENGTHVLLEHSGFERLPGAQAEYQGYVEGWAIRPALEGLKQQVEALDD